MSSTISRFRAGFIFSGGSRPAASLCPATGRRLASSDVGFPRRAASAASSRTAAAPVLLAPGVERRLADPCLAAHLRDRRSFLRLPQHKRDLLLAEPRLLHPQSPPGQDGYTRIFQLAAVQFSGSMSTTVQPQGCHRARLTLVYSITSSAWASSSVGIDKPRDFAVFRLIFSSNLIGCWTGRSAGL